MNFVEADCKRYGEWSIRRSKETDILMVRTLQEIMPERIRAVDIEIEILEEEKLETSQVHKSKNRNTVIRNGIKKKKKGNSLLGEEKEKAGYGNIQMRKVAC